MRKNEKREKKEKQGHDDIHWMIPSFRGDDLFIIRHDGSIDYSLVTLTSSLVN